MKTKLTLNVDDKIVARAKRTSAKRNVSLSALVENYLDRFSENTRLLSKTEPSLVERIKKYTHPVEISDAEIEKRKEDYLQKKYGI